MKCLKMVFLWALISFIASGCGNEIKMPAAALDYVGKNYNAVVEELSKNGFQYIETEVVEDLSSADSAKDGCVESVTINVNSSFEKGEVFPPDAQVIVKYHVIRKIKVPISSNELQNSDYAAIGKAFKNAGFTNVNIREVLDMDPDNMKSDYVNEVMIGETVAFAADEEFPYDASISVICHRPYEKFTVQLHVDCQSNLIFSKYNIDILIDGEKKELLEHGGKKDYEFRLKAGEHTFIFAEEDSDTVNGVEEVEIFSDIEISYRISCYSDKVGVETVYIDRKTELSENEAKMPASASEYKHKDYREIVASLEAAGFTNIKMDVLYDIFWGITSEGESDKVTVNGKSDFKKGEVYTKDAEIIVVYHMRMEDDPDKPTEEFEEPEGDETESGGQENTEKDGEPDNKEQEHAETEEENHLESDVAEDEILTVDNCEDLAELLNTENDEITKAFVLKYKGRQIEFDGYVADVMHYSSGSTTYKTRFNYLIYVGDYGQEHFTGPSIQYINVTYNSFNFAGDKPDSVPEGMNLHIVAEVIEFKEQQGLLILKPVSTKVR